MNIIHVNNVPKPRHSYGLLSDILKFLALALVGLVWSVDVLAAERVALVIGNSAYADRPLRNPVNDADDIAGVLTRLGFDVIQHNNVNRRSLHRALQQFREALRGKDLGLFFYAGHGAQFNQRNYLIPVKAEISDAADLPAEAISADSVLAQMQSAGSRINVVILDACRNNPYPGATRGDRGLARIEAIRGSLLAFATKPGGVAADGRGRNSPYTRALLDELAKPGVSLTDLFANVGWTVSSRTQGKQEPWHSLSPLPPVYLNTPPGTSSPPPSEITPQVTRLAVKPTPANAQVRIMNIVPKYQLGMTLAPGPYDIEVSAAGYETYRKWHELGSGEQVLNIELKRLPQVASAPSAPAPAFQTAERTGTVIQDELRSGGVGPKMVYIEGGSFQMGSPKNEEGRVSNERQHRVSVGDFYIGQYEVTFAEYDRFAESTGREKPSDSGWGRGNRPVISVSWYDAVAYAEWLSEQTGEGYRLPTEAEWEYAARAGTTTPFYFGKTISTEQANYDGDSIYGSGRKGDYLKQTVTVGSYPANAWGLHDMHGNVWEWTCSVYESNYDGNESRCKSKKNANSRAYRGGAWFFSPAGLRSAHRLRRSPDFRTDILGFRLVRSK